MGISLRGVICSFPKGELTSHQSIAVRTGDGRRKTSKRLSLRTQKSISRIVGIVNTTGLFCPWTLPCNFRIEGDFEVSRAIFENEKPLFYNGFVMIYDGV
jgi:hypothetical protein